MPIAERGEYTLKGKAVYAFLTKKDKWDKFKLDLVLTNPDELQKAKDIGLTIKQPVQGGRQMGPYITMPLKEVDSQGNKHTGIPCVDPMGNTFTDFLGDGSEVSVRFVAGPSVFKGKFSVYSVPLEVTVLKHVKYESKKAPSGNTPPKKSTPPKSQENISDEIPF